MIRCQAGELDLVGDWYKVKSVLGFVLGMELEGDKVCKSSKKDKEAIPRDEIASWKKSLDDFLVGEGGLGANGTDSSPSIWGKRDEGLSARSALL